MSKIKASSRDLDKKENTVSRILDLHHFSRDTISHFQKSVPETETGFVLSPQRHKFKFEQLHGQHVNKVETAHWRFRYQRNSPVQRQLTQIKTKVTFLKSSI